MDTIRRKLSSLLTEAANEEIKALDPQSQCAKELAEIEDVDTIIAEEIGKMCKVLTLGEITGILLLVTRLKTASGQKKEVIRNDIRKVAKKVTARTEAKSGPSKLPQSCRHIFLGI